MVVGGFDAGPGAFDHIAFEGGVMPSDVVPTHTAHGGMVTWGTDASILLQGIAVAQSQDDFMFSDVEGGGLVNNPAISTGGTDWLFV